MPDSVKKIYIAAPFPRGPELRPVRDKLTGLGYTVTSRWLDVEAAVVTPAASGHDDDAVSRASSDIDDLLAADTVISFTYPGEGKGGRHIEFGMAWAWEKQLFIVGPRENVFHTLPRVTWYPDLESLLEALNH